MTRYVIEDTTLTALSDAIRSKNDINGLPRKEFKTTFSSNDANSELFILNDMITHKIRFKVKITGFDKNWTGNVQVSWPSETGDKLERLTAANTSLDRIDTLRKHGGRYYLNLFCYIFEGDKPVTVEAVVESLDENDENYKYSPAQMIEKINSILPGPNENERVLTGSFQYRFAQNAWNWYLDKYKGHLSTKDITNLMNAFWYAEGLKEIPMDLNCSPTSNCDMGNAFNNCATLRNIPMICYAKPGNMNDMFSGCKNIIYFPDGFAEDWDWSNSDAGTGPYTGVQMDGIFTSCQKLRQLPMNILAHGNPYASAAYTIFSYLAWNCYALDEIIDLPNPHTKGTYSDTSSYNNIFYNMVTGCGRLKNLTFAEMDPVNWANQTLDFSQYTGWAQYMSLETEGRPGGITLDKKVTDDATYQALKDDPDWYTIDVAYSRYNHDSAVRTINSLPSAIEYQTSSGKKANIIKFKGEAGSATDGGAINTLTEEEIAVAAAKGWTVTLV